MGCYGLFAEILLGYFIAPGQSDACPNATQKGIDQLGQYQATP